MSDAADKLREVIREIMDGIRQAHAVGIREGDKKALAEIEQNLALIRQVLADEEVRSKTP